MKKPHIIVAVGDIDVSLSPEIIDLDYYNLDVQGSFCCSGHPLLVSLRGSPVRVSRSFNCSSTGIKSLRGCPKDVGDNFFCCQTRMTSLRNIHKYVHRIGGALHCSDLVVSNILGVLKIRDVKGLGTMFLRPHSHANSLIRAADILNKYLDHKPNPIDRDIHGCQIELIEAGLERFARL